MELVSVVVFTYNSAKTIEELLDSIGQQTYPSIELIIADDASEDNTVSLVRRWCCRHKFRFSNIILTVAKRRQGAVYNADRGIRKAHADYIKLIAGDDVLLPDCVKDNMEYMRTHAYSFVFSKVELFGDIREVRVKRPVLEKSYENLRNGKAIESLKLMYLPTPANFFTKALYEKMGGYDTRFPNWEDAPFYTKMICQNIPFGFLDKETVRYRLHKNNHLIYRAFAIDFIKVYLLVRIPALLKKGEVRFALREWRPIWGKIKLLANWNRRK